MPTTRNLRQIESEVSLLPQDDQLRLLERLVHRLRTGASVSGKGVNWSEMYGIAAHSPLGVDAQEYVTQLRDDR